MAANYYEAVARREASKILSNAAVKVMYITSDHSLKFTERESDLKESCRCRAHNNECESISIALFLRIDLLGHTLTRTHQQQYRYTASGSGEQVVLMNIITATAIIIIIYQPSKEISGYLADN